MAWSNITEDELESKKEITTSFGEPLSWQYLLYARNHPINWNTPTGILYGEKDNQISIFYIKQPARNVSFTEGVR